MSCLQRCDFEQQRASLLKQQYLCDSPLFNKGAPNNNRRESTALSEWSRFNRFKFTSNALKSHTCLTPGLSGLGPTNISGCLPLTPSTSESGTTAVAGLHQGRGRVQTPSTPELYSSLNLPYNCRWIDMTLQFSPALLSCNNYLTKYFLGGGGLWHENRYNFCIYCKLFSSWLYESAAYFKFCFCIV